MPARNHTRIQIRTKNCSQNRRIIKTDLSLSPCWQVLKGAEPRGLPLQEKLLPEYLRELGYRTHIVGKWHLGFHTKNHTPTYRGFESHLGYWTGHQDYYDHTAVEEVSRKHSPSSYNLILALAFRCLVLREIASHEKVSSRIDMK